jgi:hypothetical protein
MKKTGFFSGWIVLGVLAIVLMGRISAQSEENQESSAATHTNLTQDSAMNSVTAGTLPAEVDPDSAYAELVRLIQAGVDQSVILTYVENSLRFFNLDADGIIYLADLGAPSEIIEATMGRDKQLLQEGIVPIEAQTVEGTETTTNPPPEVTVDYFYDTLAPYGAWVYIEGYGQCWQPAVVTYNADWKPYCDNGRWVYTDSGWYWMSDYSWGWAAFHYGRWFRHDRYGWCWWPDTVWSSSWVCWRYDRTYCGWAPLPPYTSFRHGTGLVYRGSRVSVGFNFGLNSDCYTFVATRNFCDPKPRRHFVNRRDAKRIYDRTKVINRMNYDPRRKRVVNGGISPNIISTLSRQAIAPVSVRHTGSRAGNNSRHEQLNRNTRTLVVSRPDHTVPQKHTSPARISRGTQRTDPAQQRRTYAATARNNNYNSERLPEGRVQRAKPSGTRQPRTAPQARQQRSTTPPVGTNPQRPATRRPTPPQSSNKGKYVPQGNRSTGPASGRPQTKSRNTRPNVQPSGKSNQSARGNKPSRHSRPASAGSGQ